MRVSMLIKDLTLFCENEHLPAVLQRLILCESGAKWLLSVELAVTKKPVVLLLNINIGIKGLITPSTFPRDETKPSVQP